MLPDEEERLQEYIEYRANLTELETEEEFLEFTKNNFSFYPAGFGGYIESLIETEAQFFDFILRTMVQHSQKIFSDVNWWLEQEYISVDGWDSDSWDDYPHLPTETITGFAIEYNQFCEKPYLLSKTEVEIVSDFSTVHMSEKLKSQLPFIGRFCDVDSFDRAGPITGTVFEVISLKNYSPGVISFR